MPWLPTSRAQWQKLAILVAMLVWALAMPGWTAAQGIESILSPGKVIQGHAKLEDDCRQCHVKFDRQAQSGQCMDCHKDIGADMRNKTGFHGRQKPQTCSSCHTDHKGRDAHIVKFDKKNFDHTQTDFLLRGKHQPLACEKCHVAAKKYSEAGTQCNACHRKDDVHKGSLGVKCADCHNETNWKEARFDHATTRFALTGKHADVKCNDCHKAGNYKDAPRACVGCHKKDDDGIKGHKGQFGDKCESCHGVNLWKTTTFNHDTDTKYALRGKHRSTSCTTCHTGNLYRVKLSQDCYACHVKDDKHKESLGKDCGSCHSERSWKEPAKFDHDRSSFPLLGKHAAVECKDCHKSNMFKEAPRECIGCHKKDDKHNDSLGKDCRSCHTERSWKESAKFDHDRSVFPLRGQHRKVECNDCHKSAMFKEAPKDCFSCHKKDDKHNATLGEKCVDCHVESDWKITAGRFDHERTKFALRNAHAAVTLKCSACHKDLQSFRKTPVDCYSCHKKDDKHEGQSGTACEQCHSDRSWRVDRFDHAQTRFALTGRHITATCKSCHITARFKDAPRDCFSCHKKEDKHKQKFGVRCESCHNTRAWATWDFNHDKRTTYRLDGAHTKVACESCHKQDAPKGKDAAPVGSSCITCHRNDDSHDGQFGARCELCHVTGSWKKLQRRLGLSGDTESGKSASGRAVILPSLRGLVL
jgi:Class III cytochrome C family